MQESSSATPQAPQAIAEFLCVYHWNDLVRTAEAALFSYARTLPEDLVADLIADVNANHFPKLALQPTTTKLVSFAKGVVRNRAKDANRREVRLVRFKEQPPANQRLDVSRTESHALLRHEIETALAHLTPRERQVAILHWLDGWQTPDLAKKLGLARSTVKELLRRAKRKLHAALSD